MGYYVDDEGNHNECLNSNPKRRAFLQIGDVYVAVDTILRFEPYYYDDELRIKPTTVYTTTGQLRVDAESASFYEALREAEDNDFSRLKLIENKAP